MEDDILDYSGWIKDVKKYTKVSYLEITFNDEQLVEDFLIFLATRNSKLLGGLKEESWLKEEIYPTKKIFVFYLSWSKQERKLLRSFWSAFGEKEEDLHQRLNGKSRLNHGKWEIQKNKSIDKKDEKKEEERIGLKDEEIRALFGNGPLDIKMLLTRKLSYSEIFQILRRWYVQKNHSPTKESSCDEKRRKKNQLSTEIDEKNVKLEKESQRHPKVESLSLKDDQIGQYPKRGPNMLGYQALEDEIFLDQKKKVNLDIPKRKRIRSQSEERNIAFLEVNEVDEILETNIAQIMRFQEELDRLKSLKEIYLVELEQEKGKNKKLQDYVKNYEEEYQQDKKTWKTMQQDNINKALLEWGEPILAKQIELNEILEAERQKIKYQNEHNTSLKEELEEKRREIEELKSEEKKTLEVKLEESNKLKEEKEKLEKELANKENKIDELNSDLKKLIQSRNKDEDNLFKLENENKAFKEQNETLKNQITQLIHDLNTKEMEKNKLLQENNEAKYKEEQQIQLLTKFQQVQAELEQFRTAQNQLSEFYKSKDIMLSNLQQNKVQLETTEAELKAKLEEKVKEFDEFIRESEIEKTKKENEKKEIEDIVKKKEDELNRSTEAFHSLKESTKKSLEEYKNEKTKLETSLSLKNEEVEYYKENIQILTTQIDEIKQNNIELSQDLVRITKEKNEIEKSLKESIHKKEVIINILSSFLEYYNGIRKDLIKDVLSTTQRSRVINNNVAVTGTSTIEKSSDQNNVAILTRLSNMEKSLEKIGRITSKETENSMQTEDEENKSCNHIEDKEISELGLDADNEQIHNEEKSFNNSFEQEKEEHEKKKLNTRISKPLLCFQEIQIGVILTKRIFDIYLNEREKLWPHQKSIFVTRSDFLTEAIKLNDRKKDRVHYLQTLLENKLIPPLISLLNAKYLVIPWKKNQVWKILIIANASQLDPIHNTSNKKNHLRCFYLDSNNDATNSSYDIHHQVCTFLCNYINLQHELKFSIKRKIEALLPENILPTYISMPTYKKIADSGYYALRNLEIFCSFPNLVIKKTKIDYPTNLIDCVQEQFWLLKAILLISNK